MRTAIRETASILVKAPRDEVLTLLRTKLEHEPGLRVSADRLEARGATYVVRDAPEGGTHVFHARSQPASMRDVLQRPREELRQAVEADLYQVQRLLQARLAQDL